MELGRSADAIEHLREADRLGTDGTGIIRERAQDWLGLGRDAEGIAGLRVALALKPKRPGILNNLAWQLATSKDPQLRDPAEAVRLAEIAASLTQRRNPVMLDTLATALDAAGRREEGVGVATEALERARLDGEASLVRSLRVAWPELSGVGARTGDSRRGPAEVE